jgi:hypothetical protein
MTWLKLVIMLLQLVTAIMKGRSDLEQQQIGEDRVVKQLLADFIVRSKIAKQIDIDSADWSREHIDSILSKYYRDEGGDPT